MTSYRIALMNPIGQHPFDRSIDLPISSTLSWHANTNPLH